MKRRETNELTRLSNDVGSAYVGYTPHIPYFPVRE